MCKSKPMLSEEIAQLERSLLREIAAHDRTWRKLAAQEREIERIRTTLYRDRVAAVSPASSPQPLTDWAPQKESKNG